MDFNNEFKPPFGDNNNIDPPKATSQDAENLSKIESGSSPEPMSASDSQSMKKQINPLEREQEVNTTRVFDNYSYDISGLKDFSKNKNYRNGNTTSSDSKTRSKYITKKAFIACMLCGMLATSGLTIGGLALADNYTNVFSNSNNKVSATNYTLTKSTGASKSVKEIVSMNENAVVEIQTEKVNNDSWIKNYVTQGAGSGVIIDSDGYIITCHHVINGASNITVRLKDGSTKKATVIGSDSDTDIAVLKIDGSGYTAVKYGDTASLSVGDPAIAIGNPLGELGGSVSSGIISALDRQLQVEGKPMTLLQTDTSINPGNSGGGLFDSQGNLIGIVVAKTSGSNIEGIGFAIPINTASKIAKDLIENGKVSGRAVIGVNIVDLTSAENAQKYGVRSTGIYISEILSDKAKEAGLQPGDMIYYFDKTKIKSAADLRNELNKHKPGDKVKVTVIRNDETVDITVTLSEA
ncbi:MAG: trypsin-like peptidase domain-containing protein [Eubacterium sp.]|nr:trypsin-like peptidase domain-containing protein [Eubacterium sp.]